jgi:hypothetical protein
VTALRVDTVIVSCAISAGIHGALVRDHFEESTAAGAGFVLATAALAAVAIALTVRPRSRIARAAAAATFAGLIASYALAVTTGLPVLHPEVESVDGLALFTKAVEAVGLGAALLRERRALASLLEPKGI